MVAPFLFGPFLMLACVFLPSYSAQEGCSSRCGESYFRGHICHCDYNCLIHNECCEDYESMCTRSDSCKGRCGESFKRGRPCSCDPDCILYNQCCPDYQMHCGTAPPTSKLINEADLTVAPTQRSQGKNENNNQDLSDNYLIPLSTFPSPILPKDEIQGDESLEQKPHLVPVPTFEFVGTESTSGQEPSLINATESLSPDEAFTPLNTTDEPTIESEQEAIKEEISTLFPEDLLLSQSSTGTTPVPRTDVSSPAPDIQLPVETGVPNSSSPAPERQSDSTSQSPITDSKNPSATPVSERQATSTTPEAGTVTTPGTAVSSPSTSKSSDRLVATNKPTSNSTDRISSNPQEEAAAFAPTSSPSSEADGVTVPTRPSPLPLQPSKRPTIPSRLTDSTQTLTTVNPNDHLPEDNNDTNLCSGRPTSGVTTLQNGTVVVFRGHYFWVLDANRSPGPARGITETWGIPSPINTVFTRCHCDGKTYFIKGKNYWRFTNDVMDPGYPKPISAGFDNLTGKVTAALSLPAFKKRAESVYFFKTGGLVQKYTYKPGSGCSRRAPIKVYLLKTRYARQAASTDDGLGKEINIKLKWRGFPTLVTSAVSIPSPRQPDGYDYYIFSRAKYYKIKLDEEKPTLDTPLTLPSQQNSAKSWFNCP